MCYSVGMWSLLSLYLCLSPAWGMPDAGLDDESCEFMQTKEMRRISTHGASMARTSGDAPDRVTSLPGLPESFQCVHFAGYVPVYGDVNPAPLGCDEKAEMFYWFAGHGDGSDYDKKPTILWSNGGPGATSQWGFWLENGPFEIQNSSEGMTLTPNPRSWTQRANYLIFDHPLGVGLSNETSPDSALPRNATQGARQWYQALLNFLAMHPEIQQNPIALTGESYAGTYLPLLAKEILDHSEQHPIDLRGMMLGDAWVDPWVQMGSDIDYAFYHGMISEKQRLELRSVPLESLAYNLSDIAGVMTTNIALVGGDPMNAQWNVVMEYLNRDDVREAIHARGPPIVQFWSNRIGKLYEPGLYSSVRPLVNQLLDTGVTTLIVSGLNDMKDCNFLGTQAWLSLLVGPEASTFHDAETAQWKPDGEGGNVLGYIQNFGGKLSWVKVLNAGHMAVYDQPRLLDLIVSTLLGSSQTEL